MNNLSQLVRFIVTGTDRADMSALPDSVNFKQKIESPNHAPQLLLEAITAAVLLDKAGFAIKKVVGNDLQVPYNQHINQTFPSNEAIRILERILRNHDRLLMEWLTQMELKGYAIPPEYMPDLLNRAVRDTSLAQVLQRVRDPKLRWLAAQNLSWTTLFPDVEKADWFTSDYHTRLTLLKETRSKRPLVALSWLEKTWQEENNEQKLTFLAIFQENLSGFDEPLLQKALQGKSRDVRFLAASLLARIPESQFVEALNGLRQRLIPFVEAPDFVAFMQQTIPDVGEARFHILAGLIHAKETDTLRTGILLNYLNYIPPSWLSETLSLSPESILDQIQNDPDKHFTLSGIIHSSTLHQDITWARAILTYLSSRPTHPLWQSSRLVQLIAGLPDPDWDEVLSRLCRQYTLFESRELALYKVLATTDRAWPKNVLRAFMSTWYERAASQYSYNSQNWSPLLRSAAMHCLPSDALEMSTWLNHQPSLPHFAIKDLDAFWDVVKLRQKILEG